MKTPHLLTSGRPPGLATPFAGLSFAAVQQSATAWPAALEKTPRALKRWSRPEHVHLLRGDLQPAAGLI